METSSGLEPGQLVFSRAGRDRGRPFIVIRVLDDRYVEVADGDLRKIACPKRKNVRHLQAANRTATDVGQKLASGEPVKNWELRKAIEELAR